MKSGITICTWSGGKESFLSLYDSLKTTSYPIFVWVNACHGGFDPWWKWFPFQHYLSEKDEFEIGAIYGTLEHTDWDEFVLLQDTIVIKDISIFDILLEDYKGKSVAYNPLFQMYLGKYRREVLNRIPKPMISTKQEAIWTEETFAREYRWKDPSRVVFNEDFRDENYLGNIVYRFGRENMLMEDRYIQKFKGTWRK